MGEMAPVHIECFLKSNTFRKSLLVCVRHGDMLQLQERSSFRVDFTPEEKKNICYVPKYHSRQEYASALAPT